MAYSFFPLCYRTLLPAFLFKRICKRSHRLFCSFTNLIGNLVAFLPFACFVRMFYPNLKARSFFGYMSLLIIAVECLQLLSFTGSMDIDDYLLNISGAMLGFAVCSIPFIKNLLMKLKHLDK